MYKNQVVALVNALTIDDKAQYKAAYFVLEEQLQRHFEEVSVMEKGSCKLRFDALLENLIQLNHFRSGPQFSDMTLSD